MPWQDRVQEAAYTPANGQRQTFKFEDVSKSFTLQGTAFDFPDADETYIQRTGRSGRRYPMRVYLTGDDHDLDADAFEQGLSAPGIGTLEHPFYGTVQVVPFGDVGRRDDLKTAANQTIIEVTFWSTVDTTYPASQSEASTLVVAALGEYDAQAAQEFAGTTDLAGATEQASFISTYEGLQSQVVTGLSAIADTTDAVRDQFNTVNDSINQGINTLVRDPVTLAAQTLILIQAPARAAALITDRLAAYRQLASNIVDGDGSISTPSFDNTASNDFHTADLYTSTYVAGAVLSVVNNEFQTRPEALSAAEALLDFMDDVTNWRDDNYVSLGETDTGGQYQQLQEAVALAAGFLVQISFTLKQERSLVLTTDRTPVDLCAELYGQVDEVLDFFASSNNLSWQEHIEIFKGRRIVYYV